MSACQLARQSGAGLGHVPPVSAANSNADDAFRNRQTRRLGSGYYRLRRSYACAQGHVTVLAAFVNSNRGRDVCRATAWLGNLAWLTKTGWNNTVSSLVAHGILRNMSDNILSTNADNLDSRYVFIAHHGPHPPWPGRLPALNHIKEGPWFSVNQGSIRFICT